MELRINHVRIKRSRPVQLSISCGCDTKDERKILKTSLSKDNVTQEYYMSTLTGATPTLHLREYPFSHYSVYCGYRGTCARTAILASVRVSPFLRETIFTDFSSEAEYSMHATLTRLRVTLVATKKSIKLHLVRKSDSSFTGQSN